MAIGINESWWTHSYIWFRLYLDGNEELWAFDRFKAFVFDLCVILKVINYVTHTHALVNGNWRWQCKRMLNKIIKQASSKCEHKIVRFCWARARSFSLKFNVIWPNNMNDNYFRNMHSFVDFWFFLSQKGRITNHGHLF